MDTLLRVIPKLDSFSEKQLNQNYLQMRLGPYLSLHRGDSYFAQILEHNRLCESLNGLLHVSLQICTMQNLKAGMTLSNEDQAR